MEWKVQDKVTPVAPARDGSRDLMYEDCYVIGVFPDSKHPYLVCKVGTHYLAGRYTAADLRKRYTR